MENNEELFFAQYKAQRIKELVVPFQPKTMVDIGCGQGHLTYYLQELFWDAQVTGVDKDAQQIEHAQQQYPGVLLRQSEDLSLFATTSTDVVVAALVFHHISRAGHKAMIEEIMRILRPGGVFVLLEWNPWHIITRVRVARDPEEKDAVLLSSRYAKKLLAPYGQLSVHHYCHIPKLLSWLTPLETFLEHVPLGEFYAIKVIKK